MSYFHIIYSSLMNFLKKFILLDFHAIFTSYLLVVGIFYCLVLFYFIFVQGLQFGPFTSYSTEPNADCTQKKKKGLRSKLS